MIEPDDLKLVAAVAAAGSVRRAADAQRIHLATAYRRLATLEGAIGQPLFVRDGRAWIATALGLELANGWADVAERLGDLDRRVALHDGALDGELRIATTDSLLAELVEALDVFRAAHPGVRLDITIGNGFADMARREADIAIRPTATPPETLVGRKLAGFHYALYGRPDIPDCLALDESLSAIPAAVWWREAAESTPVIRFNSMWAMAAGCAAGLGRAVLPAYLGRRFALTPLSEPIDALASAVWLLYHPDAKRSPRTRAFVDSVAPLVAKRLKRPS